MFGSSMFLTLVITASIFVIPVLIQGGCLFGLARAAAQRMSIEAALTVVLIVNIAQWLVVGDDSSAAGYAVNVALWVMSTTAVVGGRVQWTLGIALLMSIVQLGSMGGALLVVAPALAMFV